ncbi:MAG: hypothetical protein WAK17_03395 [Candidatus Nitrosopolaris sp.]|jgi:hypothetical protein
MIEHIQRRQPIAKDINREAITLEPDKTLYYTRNTLFIYNISRVVIAKVIQPPIENSTRLVYESKSKS